VEESSSSVTGRAGLERLDIVIVHHLFTLQLLEAGILLWIILVPLPIQIRDLVLRTHLRRWVAMAIEAECHAQRLIMVNLFHLVDGAVTFDAAYAAIDVDGVIEINEVGHAMNLDPGNRFAALGAFANQSQARIIFEHLIMAIHAGRTGGNIRIPRFLDGIVAVTAINPELAGMSRVRK